MPIIDERIDSIFHCEIVDIAKVAAGTKAYQSIPVITDAGRKTELINERANQSTIIVSKRNEQIVAEELTH
ncbi:hypothetical protein MASR1M31_19690 [Porphyromonadaceae bacterium]